MYSLLAPRCTIISRLRVKGLIEGLSLLKKVLIREFVLEISGFSGGGSFGELNKPFEGVNRGVSQFLKGVLMI